MSSRATQNWRLRTKFIFGKGSSEKFQSKRVLNSHQLPRHSAARSCKWLRAELETTANRNGQMNKKAVKKGSQIGLLKIKAFHLISKHSLHDYCWKVWIIFNLKVVISANVIEIIFFWKINFYYVLN